MSKRSGRVVFDDRGNSRWEWQTDSGSFKSDIDTSKLKSLTDSPLSVTDRHAMPGPGFNPYNNAERSPAANPAQKPRKSLDDLRKLSEHIKNSKHWKNDRS